MNRILCMGFLAVGVALVSAPARADVIYASNFNSNTITAYDSTTGALLGTPVMEGSEASGFNGVRVDGTGNFYVAAQLSNNILKYNASGSLLFGFDPANAAGLSSPQEITFGPDGKLYAASSGNDRIVRYDPVTGAFLDTFADLSAGGHAGPIGMAFGPDGNLYVTSFDSGEIFKINGQTGAVLGSTLGPVGFGLGPSVFGPDGGLYVEALDLSTFAGSVFRYDPGTTQLTTFIAAGVGGLVSPGGIAFDRNGNILLSNLIFDQNFNDGGSTILRYSGSNGAFLGELVSAGQGLDIPFFMITAVPEPSSTVLLAIGLLGLAFLSKRRFHRA